MAGGILGIGGRDYGQVVGRGGNDIQIVETEDDGSYLASEVFVTVGHLLTTKPIGTYPIDSTPLEDASQVRVHGVEEVGLEFQLAQQVDWAALGDSIVGKTFGLYWNRGIFLASKTREILAIGKLEMTDGGAAFPGSPGGPALRFLMLKTEVAIQFATVPSGEINPFPGSPVMASPQTIPIDKYLLQVDTTNP